jgi:hypothetical protein
MHLSIQSGIKHVLLVFQEMIEAQDVRAGAEDS